MDENKYIFLSMKEAVSAIRIDFNHYPPQTGLFMDLCPLILGPDIAVTCDSQSSLWIKQARGRRTSRMQRITYPDLGRLLINTLEKSTPSADLMAEICSRVFLTRAEPSRNGIGAETGIRIDTGMENFKCRQCGRCCRKLDYRNEVSAEDYLNWQELERKDILERIATISRNGRIISYAAWVEPGTRRFADVCPWLVPADKKDKTGQWVCKIHDIKPEICRQYPGTRKHAQMTGCIGFGD
ncbi:MAG: YkgJ family cysteine cluster protein [Desulfobacterales bacterium]